MSWATLIWSAKKSGSPQNQKHKYFLPNLNSEIFQVSFRQSGFYNIPMNKNPLFQLQFQSQYTFNEQNSLPIHTKNHLT